jgi:TonB-linked SusC/RagA family outer membrane protein
MLNTNPNFMMRTLQRFTLLWGMMLFGTSIAMAQGRTISGAVSDETGSPLPGVNIILKGTTTGTTTDLNGRYTILVPNDEAILVVTFVGFATSEQQVGARTSIDIQLKPDITTLSELVVTGYAIQEKKDITGSVGIVKASDLVSVPAPTAEGQLQGRVAGVNIISNGIPGNGSSVRIRGFASFGGTNAAGVAINQSAPLYVIDGVPTYDLTTFNPNDIESISVLKDAGAASIYGARASNGVIAITTKKGTPDGKLKLTYDMYYGLQDPGKGFDNLLNPQEQADLEWLAKRNDGAPLQSTMYGNGANAVLPDYILPSGVSEGNALADPSLYNYSSDPNTFYQITKANKEGTDWYKELTQVAPIQSHNVGLAGGSANSKYFVGLNYFNQQGIIIDTYSKRYSVRANTEFNFKNKVRIGENLVATYRTNPQSPGALRGTPGSSFANNSEGNAIANSFRIQRIVPVYDIMGNFAGTRGADLGNGANPVAAQVRAKNSIATDMRVFGNLYAEVDLMQGLTARSSFGGSMQYGHNTQFTSLNLEASEPRPSNNYSENAFWGSDWVWTNLLTYKKTIGQHNVNVIGGIESVKKGMGANMFATRSGYFVEDPNFISLNQGSTGQTNAGQPGTPSTLFSVFGRADYSFKDKYYLSGTIRRDGSSKFAASERYGTFPSVTAGWRASAEPFLSSVAFITDLKIRGGWGTMGNENNVNASNQFEQFGGGINTTYYDLSGANSGSNQGFGQTAYANNRTKWETNETTNIGFDASLAEAKVNVTFDWYQKVTKDLLFNPEFPSTYGLVATPYLNIGKMTNKGIELQINYRTKIANDFRIDLTGTFTTFKNNIDAIAPGYKFFDVSSGEENRLGERFVRNAVGHSLSSFYGYKVVGIIQPSDTVNFTAAEKNAGMRAGVFKFADTNGDRTITEDDKQFLGSPVPDFTYGLNITTGYKNFEFTVFLYGVQGAEIMNFTKWWTDFPSSFRGAKSKEALYNSWTPERPDGTTPLASYNYSNIFTNKSSNSYYLEDGSYLRARSVQIAYNLPSPLLDKWGITRARVYVQGANLFTATRYTGLNPELGGNDSNFGVDLGNYPTPKQYLMGLNISF